MLTKTNIYLMQYFLLEVTLKLFLEVTLILGGRGVGLTRELNANWSNAAKTLRSRCKHTCALAVAT